MNLLSYLRESAIVPDVAVVGKAVADVAKLTLPGVLSNRVKIFVLGYLGTRLDRWDEFPRLLRRFP